jgi:hypothetical protein
MPAIRSRGPSTTKWASARLETPDGNAVLLAGHSHLMMHSWTGEPLGRLRWPSMSRLAWGSEGQLWSAAGAHCGGHNLWRADWERLRAALIRAGGFRALRPEHTTGGV